MFFIVANAAPAGAAFHVSGLAASATAVAAWLIVLLLGIIAWFVRREIKQNDAAHDGLRSDIGELRKDVKVLLTGLARIEGYLGGAEGRVPDDRRPGDINPTAG